LKSFSWTPYIYIYIYNLILTFPFFTQYPGKTTQMQPVFKIISNTRWSQVSHVCPQRIVALQMSYLFERIQQANESKEPSLFAHRYVCSINYYLLLHLIITYADIMLRIINPYCEWAYQLIYDSNREIWLENTYVGCQWMKAKNKNSFFSSLSIIYNFVNLYLFAFYCTFYIVNMKYPSIGGWRWIEINKF